MPQPLSRVNPSARVKFGGAELHIYPKLASLAMEAIAAVSYAENAKGKTLAALLGANSEVGLAMFTSLTSTVAQDAALSAAVDMALDADDKAIFNEIKRITKPFISRRNDFAHHMWGISEDIPDAFLLMDSKHYIDQSPDTPDIFRPTSYDRRKIFVYTENDLQRELKGALQTAIYFQHFCFYVSLKQISVIPHHSEQKDAEKIQYEIDSKIAQLRASLPTPSTPQPRSR